MADKNTKAGFGSIDPEKTTVFNPPANPDDPATMQELKVLTPEEEEAQKRESEELLAKAKWGTGTKIFAALAAIAAIVAIIMLSLANMPGKDEIRTTSLPPKATAPAAPKVDEAPAAPRQTVSIRMKQVAVADLTSCKRFSVIRQSDGNTRIVGTDCGGDVAPAAPAQAEAPPAPAAPAAIVDPTASTAPATETTLTEAEQKTATIVAEVTDEVLEEMHGVDEEPEGAIEAADLESATDNPSAE